MLCLSQGIHNIIYMLHCGLLSSLSNSLYVVLKIGNVLKLEKVLKFIFEKKVFTVLKTRAVDGLSSLLGLLAEYDAEYDTYANDIHIHEMQIKELFVILVNKPYSFSS